MDKNILPDHYRDRRIEVMDFIHDTCTTNNQFTPVDGYQYGNVVKYLSRAGLKGQKLQDLRKAQEHLRRWILHEEQHSQIKQAFYNPPHQLKKQTEEKQTHEPRNENNNKPNGRFEELRDQIRGAELVPDKCCDGTSCDSEYHGTVFR